MPVLTGIAAELAQNERSSDGALLDRCGQPKQRLAEIHSTSMKRLSKVEATDDPHDGAGEE